VQIGHRPGGAAGCSAVRFRVECQPGLPSVASLGCELGEEVQGAGSGPRARLALETPGLCAALGIGLVAVGCSDREGAADLRRALGAAAVGLEAEVADAHEAPGQDVEQESAHQLRGVQPHELVGAGVVVV
jgi:hypothetical protein